MDITTINGLYELGKSLALQGKIKEADDKFKQAIEGIPYEAEGVEDILYKLYKARLDMNIDNVEERNSITAIMIDTFSTVDEYQEQVYYDLAQVHKMTGDQVRYINALQQIITRFEKPKDYVYFELAIVQQNFKEMTEAIKNYITYLNLIGKKHPNMTISALNLSTCYNAVNQPERAQQTLKRYLNIK